MPGTGSDYCQRAGGWTPDNPGIRVRQSAWDAVVNLIGSGAPGSCKAFDASMREEPFATDMTAEDRPASCTVLDTDAAWVQATAIPADATLSVVDGRLVGSIAASTGYREMRTTMCAAVANYNFSASEFTNADGLGLDTFAAACVDIPGNCTYHERVSAAGGHLFGEAATLICKDIAATTAAGCVVNSQAAGNCTLIKDVLGSGTASVLLSCTIFSLSSGTIG